MLFLILNRVELNPYIDINEPMFPEIPFVPYPDIGNGHDKYSDLYKEMMQQNWKDDICYMVGIVVSSSGIWYFSKEISKSIRHSG